MKRLIHVAGLAALCAAVTACGGQSEITLPTTGASLEGTVSYNGQPLQFALVMVSNGRDSAAGKIGDDGRYKVDSVPLGDIMIGVNTKAGMGDFQSKAMAAGAYKGPESKGKAKVDVKFVDIPPKYYDPATSGLKCTTVKGPNTHNIEIKG